MHPHPPRDTAAEALAPSGPVASALRATRVARAVTWFRGPRPPPRRDVREDEDDPAASFRQDRNTMYLMLNAGLGAASGLLFWLVVVRAYGFSEHDVGVGVAVVSLATAVALLAKGGLDAALVRTVPRTTSAEGRGMLRGAVARGTLAALGWAGLAAAAIHIGGRFLPAAEAAVLVAALAVLMMVTWLQDAHFLAEGDAGLSFRRNLVLHAARLLAPGVVVAVAAPYPIALAWGLALGASSLAAVALLRLLPARTTAPAPQRGGVGAAGFLRTARRNVAGNAMEFLPGLLLPPLVLGLHGPPSAAYFGIAWAGASMLVLLSTAISRSTFAELSRHAAGRAAAEDPGSKPLPAAPAPTLSPPSTSAASQAPAPSAAAPPPGAPWSERAPARGDRALRRAAQLHVAVVAPVAALTALAAPWVLGLFGPAYAAHGTPVFWVLAAGVAVAAPVYLVLALLRTREETLPLLVVPSTVLLGLALLVVPLDARFGMPGVAMAWAAAHVPAAAWACWRLRRVLAGDEASDPQDVPARSRGLPGVPVVAVDAARTPSSEQAEPALTVVVLTWNEERRVSACLKALAAQPRRDFEVVVVDAASRDATVARVRLAQRGFPVPLRLHVASERLPVGPARNLGVAMARAPRIAFLSADAVPEPGWVDALMRGLDRADLVFGSQRHAPERWNVGAAVRGLRYHHLPGEASAPRAGGEAARLASNVNAAAHRELLLALPFGAAQADSAVDDLLLARSAVARGARVAYLPDMRVAHRDVDSSWQELRKNVREGLGWGVHAKALGFHRAALAWTAMLALALAGAVAATMGAGIGAAGHPAAGVASSFSPLSPGTLAAIPAGASWWAFLAAAVWTPALRRAWLLRGRRNPGARPMPPAAVAIGVLAAPLFDLAFLASYLRGLAQAGLAAAAGPSPGPPGGAAAGRDAARIREGAEAIQEVDP